jgi:hypothetical protein
MCIRSLSFIILTKSTEMVKGHSRSDGTKTIAWLIAPLFLLLGACSSIPLEERDGIRAVIDADADQIVARLIHEDGMLDKFIGDAMMAAFGIPIAHTDDEDRAVRAAIAMISELQEWNPTAQ